MKSNRQAGTPAYVARQRDVRKAVAALVAADAAACRAAQIAHMNTKA